MRFGRFWRFGRFGVRVMTGQASSGSTQAIKIYVTPDQEEYQKNKNLQEWARSLTAGSFLFFFFSLFLFLFLQSSMTIFQRATHTSWYWDRYHFFWLLTLSKFDYSSWPQMIVYGRVQTVIGRYNWYYAVTVEFQHDCLQTGCIMYTFFKSHFQIMRCINLHNLLLVSH